MTPRKLLRVGLLTEVESLDPRRPLEAIGGSVVPQIFEPPFAFPREGRPAEPLLFSGPLERGADALGKMVWVGTVRPGITFSDGTALAADHIASSLVATGVLVGKATVEARGERVVFTLERPNARFHLALTQGGCGVFLERGSSWAPAPSPWAASARGRSSSCATPSTARRCRSTRWSCAPCRSTRRGGRRH